jgi:phosphoglycolate phosphatase
MTRRLAIFDLDGTLVDSVDDLAASVNHALARVGLPPRRRDEVRAMIGNGARMLMERAVGEHRQQLDAVVEAWREHYTAHLLDATRPYPGVVEALARAGRALAVLSNKPGPMVRQIVEGLGLAARFAEVLGGGDVPPKPGPAGVRTILARLGVAEADAVLVGDSAVDAATARNAGIAFVAVTWGLASREELVAAGAVNLVDRAEDLAPWLA